MKLGIPPCH